MADVPLSETVKKLSRDFALEDGRYRMPAKKLKAWRAELDKLDPAERPGTAQELIALAISFERQGGEAAAEGAAQLYVLAAPLMPRGGEGAPRPRKAGGGGWGPKK